LDTVTVFDDEEASETYGERVEYCPRCARKRGVHRLSPKTSGGYLEATSGKIGRGQEHLERAPPGKLFVGETPPLLDVLQSRKRLLKVRPEVREALVRCRPEQVRWAASRQVLDRLAQERIGLLDFPLGLARALAAACSGRQAMRRYQLLLLSLSPGGDVFLTQGRGRICILRYRTLREVFLPWRGSHPKR
jgi:hypothetical protein